MCQFKEFHIFLFLVYVQAAVYIQAVSQFDYQEVRRHSIWQSGEEEFDNKRSASFWKIGYYADDVFVELYVKSAF